MEEQKDFKLFREHSLEAIESPESMNDYLQVTSPGIWLVLAAVIAILMGALLWSVFGRINTSVNVAVVSELDQQTCYIPFEKLEQIMSSGFVEVDGKLYKLQMVSNAETMIISESTNPYIRVKGDFHLGDMVVQVPVAESLPEGIYMGKVITESLQPISLLIQ